MECIIFAYGMCDICMCDICMWTKLQIGLQDDCGCSGVKIERPRLFPDKPSCYFQWKLRVSGCANHNISFENWQPTPNDGGSCNAKNEGNWNPLKQVIFFTSYLHTLRELSSNLLCVSNSQIPNLPQNIRG